MPVHSHQVLEILREDDTHDNRVPRDPEFVQEGAIDAGVWAPEGEASLEWCRTVEVVKGLRFRLSRVSPD